MDTKVVIIIVIGLVVIYIWTQRNSTARSQYLPPIPPPQPPPVPETYHEATPRQESNRGGYESFGFGSGESSTGGLMRLPYNPLQGEAPMEKQEYKSEVMTPFPTNRQSMPSPEMRTQPPMRPEPRSYSRLPPERPAPQRPAPPPQQPHMQRGPLPPQQQQRQAPPMLEPKRAHAGAVLSGTGPQDGLSQQFDSLFSADQSDILKKR